MLVGRNSYGTSGSCGIDLYAAEDVVIDPQTYKVIDVGLRLTDDFPVHYFGLIKDRSSLAAKGLRVGAGVIDSDYRGPIKVVMMNHNFWAYTITCGDVIAQMVILSYVRLEGVPIGREVRGEGGFGSTNPD